VGVQPAGKLAEQHEKGSADDGAKEAAFAAHHHIQEAVNGGKEVEYVMEYVRERGKWKIILMNWTERLGLPGGGPPEGLW
jgi:hypothetical protein